MGAFLACLCNRFFGYFTNQPTVMGNMCPNRGSNYVVGEKYGKSDKDKFFVPEDKRSWNISFLEYKPDRFTDPSVLKDKQGNKPVWADFEPEIWKDNPPKWNEIDSITVGNKNVKINRKSFIGKYKLEKIDGIEVPLNPKGRTGLKGRGLLGRWGPNHAADPIVTRWKPDSNEKILQFVSIQRRDTNQWAIPGGMVDADERINDALKREFGEEALAELEVSSLEEKEKIKQNIDIIFSSGKMIFQGYVKDPRNTDNAWMETEAWNFHDETGKAFGKIQLKAGDDAKNVEWKDISKDIDLYASHSDFVLKVAELHNADL